MPSRRRTDRMRKRWWLPLALLALAMLAFGAMVGKNDQHPDARLEKDLAPLTEPRVLRAERIARVIWGEVCGGDVAVAIAPLADGQAGQASWEINEDGSFSRCTIIVAPRDQRGRPWSFRMLCGIVVHEVGHLAGQRHVSNPRSIMFPRCSEKNIPRRCLT